MSRSSRDYYHSSRGTTLPPIRDVIGDVLAQPARSGDSSPRTRSPDPDPPAHPSAPFHLPPIRPSGEASSLHPGGTRYSSSQDYRMQSPPPHPSQTPRRRDLSLPSVPHHSSPEDYRMHSPSPRPTSHATYRPEASSSSSAHRSHSYDVFVATSDQGLVHRQSSRQDNFHQVTKEDVIANSTGKHVCPECQRRFEKLSTLKNHSTTHTGERPHECPDCGKTFSVYTNMRRHQQIHKRSGTAD